VSKPPSGCTAIPIPLYVQLHPQDTNSIQRLAKERTSHRTERTERRGRKKRQEKVDKRKKRRHIRNIYLTFPRYLKPPNQARASPQYITSKAPPPHPITNRKALHSTTSPRITPTREGERVCSTFPARCVGPDLGVRYSESQRGTTLPFHFYFHINVQ